MGRKEMSDSPRTDEVWGGMRGSVYQLMLLCQKLERELAESYHSYRLLDAGYETMRERAEKAEAQVAELKMLYQNEADNHNATMAENAALRELLGRAKWYVLDSVEYIEDEGDIEVAMELYGSIRGVVDAARGYAKNDAK
jgi:hypothetical protein